MTVRVFTSSAFRLALFYSLCCCLHISHQFVKKHSPNSPHLSQLRSAYDQQRLGVRHAEQRLRIGGSQLRLSAAERALDAHLLRLKRREFAAGLADPTTYAPAMHFFDARPLIERSAVFALLRRMPKAGLLHAHSSAMVSIDWFVQNLTYHAGMLRCTTAQGGELRLTFRRADWHGCAADAYRSVAAERAAAADRRAYDAQLERTLGMNDNRRHFSSGQEAWQRFDSIFRAVSDALTYADTFRLVFWRLLQEVYDDGVMYVEIRTGFTLIYYDDDRPVTERDVVRELQVLIIDFIQSHTDFLGVKFIYSKSRNTDDADDLMSKYRALKAEFPDLIVGFDLVGQEDVGKPLYTFIDKLLTNRDIEYMFHAGETDWQGDGSDDNMLDAILLNTTRIGHGYSLYKHPVLLDYVRRRQICLEICPISNQVLGLVTDLRNHPATVYSALNVPMVVASDDPGFWGATGLSYDLYYALMAFTGVDTGLTYVKQLLLNSLKYSMLRGEERRKANGMFERQWQRFVDEMIESEEISQHNDSNLFQPLV